MGKILLYYKYVTIEYPKQLLKWQQTLCGELELKGRIIIAHEGINGTVGGTDKNTALYKKAMLEHPLFGDIDFKQSEGGADCFPRLRIVIKDEVVHLGLDPETTATCNGADHLNPKDAHALLQKKPKDLVIFDARNRFESKVGTFTDAITPNIRYFRQLPEYIDEHLDQFKDKQVLMFCTGGIRCERASAYLKSKGVAKKIYQLKGGIHTYAEHYPNGFFKGKNYVFDSRVTVKISDDIIGRCDVCNDPCDEYTNCLNALCNKHFISCVACLKTLHNTCSKACLELVQQKKVTQRPLFQKTNINSKVRE